jgi:DDE domain
MCRLGEAGGMTSEPATYPGHRFPAEIIGHAVRLHHVFGLSLRDVEPILAERGIAVTHEGIRQRCLRFGGDFAHKLRRRRPRPGDTWHLDEVCLRINGVLHYLWRAVDQNDVVLDILVQARRNATAAKRFFRHLLSDLKYKPRRIVTDCLRGSVRPRARGPHLADDGSPGRLPAGGSVTRGWSASAAARTPSPSDRNARPRVTAGSAAGTAGSSTASAAAAC